MLIATMCGKSMKKMFNKKWRILALAIMLVNCRSAIAQIINYDTYLDSFASAYVNSLDEFIQHFNAEEFHPEINTENDENLRIRSILTLFDWQSFQVQDSIVVRKLVSFAESVCNDSIRLNLEDDGLYAEALCLFAYKGQEIPINLVLVFENIRDDYYKWAVAGANGLMQCKLLDTICEGYINPVQHEVHFSELSAACADLNKYISVGKKVDQLSFLLGMLKSGQLEFVACNKVLFHFSQVPDYIFVVDKINRLDYNSGYLIIKLERTEELKKQDYIERLLGK